MNNIITTRDLAMVTSDIQYAQRRGAEQLVSNLIEIGRLLVEARTMVEPKDWEGYIWDNFGYSTSSADNWIKLYKEYGDNQESLFSSFRDSQTFGRMSYTKLLALAAIPAEEREEFVEKNHVEDLSTRQLQQLIKERDEAVQAKEEAEKHLDTVGKKVLDMEAREKAYKKELEAAQQAQAAAEKSKAEIVKTLEGKLDELDKAQAAERAIKKELEKARENPDVPESVMERLRREAEAQAAEKATEDIRRELDVAKRAVEEADKARKAAEAAVKEAEEKVLQAQRAAKMQDPDVAVFQSFYIQLQETWNRTVGAYQKVRQRDDVSAANCCRALMAAINKFQSDIAGEV